MFRKFHCRVLNSVASYLKIFFSPIYTAIGGKVLLKVDYKLPFFFLLCEEEKNNLVSGNVLKTTI